MEKALLSWSGGKDAAMALEKVKTEGIFEIVAIITTVTEPYDRVSMHGVRRELLEEQPDRLDLPLEIIKIPVNANNALYEERMEAVLSQYYRQGVETVIFGDLFIEEIRKYREEQLARAKMKGYFPLWNEPTTETVSHFLTQGYQAITVCVDSEKLSKKFAGKPLNKEFFQTLPDDVDFCGENGEFHTFVYDAPIFKTPINIKTGEVILRDERFYFCEVTSGKISG